MNPPTPRDMPPRSSFAWRPASEQLAAARAVLLSARQQIDDSTTEGPGLVALRRQLATALNFSGDRVAGLLQESGISHSLHETLTQARVDRFINAAYTSPPKPPAPRTLAVRNDAPRAAKDHREQQRREHHATKQERQQEEKTRRQERERRLREQVETNRALSLARIAARPRRPSRRAPTAPPRPARQTVSTPACRRIVDGLTSGVSAQLTADFYQAIAELTVYGSTSTARELSLIAADRFGIHTDPATAAQLHAQAVRTMDEGIAGAQLDELDRLQRRPRGLFYDGHRDRITLWDSAEDGTVRLHTCTGPELRRCAAAAVEYGDLTIPPVRIQAVDDRYLPIGPDDPALILAEAAAQLGRQAAAVVHHLARGNADESKQSLSTGSGASMTGQLRHVTAAVWVVPVTGMGKELTVGHLEESYTRHVPGARTRAAALVREHRRRRAGAGPEEAPTITVRGHLRRGTGPAEPRPSVTRVRYH